MANEKSGRVNSLQDLFGEIEDEVQAECEASMSQEDQRLAEIARRLLRLERDMTMLGTPTPAATRVERLSKFIEEERF